MSNYLRAILSSPMTYVILATLVAVVTYGIATLSHSNADVEILPPISQQSAPAPAEHPCAFLKCTEFDEEGRAIVMLGELPLHIPKNVVQAGRPTHAKMRDLQFGICWHNRTLLGWCSGVENVVSIRLSRIDEPMGYPFADAEEHLLRKTGGYGEPVESEFPGVYEHETRGSGQDRMFSLGAVDDSGRYAVATCGHFAQYYGCEVDYVQHPRMRVEYRFHFAHLADWPVMHSSVEDLLASFIVTRAGRANSAADEK